MRMRKLGVDWVVMLALMLSVSTPAYAYIDPGTGSVVTTTILGFLGAAAYTLRKYAYRVKDVFSKKKHGRDDNSRSDRLDG